MSKSGIPVSTIDFTLMTPLAQREAAYGKRYVRVVVHIDGKEADCGQPWDYFGLHMAGVRPGRFWFANCPDCGEPACAGVYWPAIAEHKGGKVHWRIPTQPWKRPPDMPRRARFDRDQYRAECIRLVDALRECATLAPAGVPMILEGDDGMDMDRFMRAVDRVARTGGVPKSRLRYQQAQWKDDQDTGGY
jgi:hypothetical protein